MTGEELVPPELFDEDYLWFYEQRLEKGSDAAVDLILRVLDLPDGAALLDAPCGHGRIARRLAERGFRVTGLDRSRLFLDRATGDVEYVEGDMRDLPFAEAQFDAVVNWFSSFGYFDDEGNMQVLHGFRRVLNPGGALVLEQASRDFLLANLPASGQAVWLTERGDDLMIDKVTFDPVAGRSHTERIIVRDGRVRRTGFALAQPTVPELARMLRDAGFAHVEALDESGGPFKVGSRRVIMLARA